MAEEKWNSRREEELICILLSNPVLCFPPILHGLGTLFINISPLLYKPVVGPQRDPKHTSPLTQHSEAATHY